MITTDLTNAEYHARPEISKSGLDLVAKSPAHFRAGWRGIGSDTARVGSALHAVVLERGRGLVTMPNTAKRSKADRARWSEWFVEHGADPDIVELPAAAWLGRFEETTGLTAVSEEERDTLGQMSHSILANPIAGPLLEGDGIAEASIVTELHGVPFRARPDWISETGGVPQSAPSGSTSTSTHCSTATETLPSAPVGRFPQRASLPSPERGGHRFQPEKPPMRVLQHEPRMSRRETPYYQQARPSDIAVTIDEFGELDRMTRERAGKPLLLLDRWHDVGVMIFSCIGGGRPDTIDDALDPESMRDDMKGVICIGNTVPSLEFAAVERPELDWSAIDRGYVYRFLVEHEIARCTHRSHLPFRETPAILGADDRGDMQRAFEIDADRRAWAAVYPGQPLPRRRGAGRKRDGDACLRRRAEYLHAHTPKPIDTDPTTHMPVTHFEHGMPFVDPYWHSVKVQNGVAVALWLRDLARDQASVQAA